MSVSKSRRALARSRVEGLEPRVLLSATQLDPAFANNGVFQLGTIGHANQAVEDELVQPDGKILTLGDIHGDGVSQIVVRRYNPNGSVDATFGSGGAALITDPASANNVTGAAMSLGPDGKIAVFGIDGSQLLIARLLPAGTLDTAFNSSGVVTFSTPQGNTIFLGPRAIMLTSDDKITYSAVNETYQQCQMGRFNPDGSVDSSVGANGVFPLPAFQFEMWALAPLANGQFLAAGGVGEYPGVTLARFNQNGSLDTTFGTGGTSSITLSGGLGYQEGRALAIQPDGKIVVAGRDSSYQYEASINEYAEVVRFNANGSPDTSFGSNGGIILSPYAAARQVSVLSTGQIAVVTEDPPASPSSSINLLMLTSAGHLDPTFNSTGVVNPQLTGSGSAERSVGLALSQGLPVVAGADSQWNADLARFTLTGAPDSGFGQNGRVTTMATAPGHDIASQVLPTPDGGVIVAGSTARDGNVLLKLTPAGALDTTFANAGKFVLGGAETAIVGLSDGRVYVAEQNSGGGSSILRLTAGGILDTSWGTQGTVTLTVSTQSIAVDPTNGSLVVGSGGQLRRFFSDGTPDTSFAGQQGTAGVFNSNSAQLFGLAVQGDGKIVAAASPNGGFGVLRLNANGTSDASFGSNGIVTYGGSGEATQVALLSDGRILLVGQQTSGTNFGWFVERLMPNGSPDVSFNSTGSEALGNSGNITSLQLQPDGKMLLAGIIYSGVAWARLDADGSLDTTFGVDGEYAWGAASGWKTSTALAEDTLGRVVTAGAIYSAQSGYDLAVARFQTGTRGSITGNIFNDTNNNGHPDAGEAGMAGVTVYIDLNNNGRLDPGEPSIATDSAGNYRFDFAVPGPSMVRELVPAGDAQTTPLGYAAAVTVVEEQSVAAPAIGNVQISSVPMNMAYLLTVVRDFGRQGTFASGDLNGDGTVNLADFLLLSRNFGGYLPSPALSAASTPMSGHRIARRVAQ